MASLGLPAPFRQVLQALNGLDDKAAHEVIEALRTAAAFESIGDLRDRVRTAMPEGRQTDADRLVPALLSLRGQLRGTPPERIAEAASNSPHLDLDETSRSRLRDRLTKALSAEAVTTTATALELLTQHDRNYQTARIVTDVRAVFTEDVDKRPYGAVLVQMLQLQTWGREGNEESTYVAMDEADLIELRETINRALRKTKTLRALLEEQGLAYFELDKREM